jgi:hypothetical protein
MSQLAYRFCMRKRCWRTISSLAGREPEHNRPRHQLDGLRLPKKEVRMRRLVALVYMCVLTAGCSGVPAVQRLILKGAATTAAPHPGIAPLAMTGNPPSLPVDPQGGGAAAGWRAFSSPELGIDVDYPADWSAVERADGATFTSPQGGKIDLQVVPVHGGAPLGLRTGQCATLINAHGLSIESCLEPGRQTYSARFRTRSKEGSSQEYVLSTVGPATVDVYRLILESVRPAQ